MPMVQAKKYDILQYQHAAILKHTEQSVIKYIVN